MDPARIISEVREGKFRAVARLIRLLEDEPETARPLLKELHPLTGRAEVVGLTGSPGVGKSSLTDRLVSVWRAAGRKVGVLAVDPTSPFTGGALLGDRVRMQDHATDPGVFIRSLATRGAFGGLAPAVKGSRPKSNPTVLMRRPTPSPSRNPAPLYCPRSESSVSST